MEGRKDGRKIWSAVGGAVAGLLVIAGLYFALKDDEPAGPGPSPVASDGPGPVVSEGPGPVVSEGPGPGVSEGPGPVVSEGPGPVVSEGPGPVASDEPEDGPEAEPPPKSLLAADEEIEELIRWLDISKERAAYEAESASYLRFLNESMANEETEDSLVRFKERQKEHFAAQARWGRVEWTQYDAERRLVRMRGEAVAALTAAARSESEERSETANEILREIEWLADLNRREGGDGELLPGEVMLFRKTRIVAAPGVICLTEGALEYFACLKGGKTHESVIAITCLGKQLDDALKAAGYEPGPESGGLTKQGDEAKPVGDPVVVLIEWLDERDQPVRVRAEDLITDLRNGRAMERTPFIYTGSSYIKDDKGRVCFRADLERVAIAVFADVAAILNNPLETRKDDTFYAARTAAIPPRGTFVKVVVVPPAEEDLEKVPE